MKNPLFISFVFLFALFSLNISASASACISIWDNSEQELRSRQKTSEAIFVGEVVKIFHNSAQPVKSNVDPLDATASTQLLEEILDRNQLLVSLHVKEYWKGNVAANIDVITWDVSYTDAGYPFEIGKSYLVFAEVWKGKLMVGECSGVRYLEDANYELKILGKSKIPDKKKI